MTAEEIKNASESSKTEAGWLKEIAYQLAVLNEKQSVPAAIAEEELCYCGKKQGHVGRHKFVEEMRA